MWVTQGAQDIVACCSPNPNMNLDCTTNRLTGIRVSWACDFPPNSWFVLVAKAGKAVTGVATKRLEAAARKCRRVALKTEEEGLPSGGQILETKLHFR